MTNELTYECTKCRKKITVVESNKQPECCGTPMKQLPLDICLQPSHPEHARSMDHEEPCDDFRDGT
jgi:hypothetical protein